MAELSNELGDETNWHGVLGKFPQLQYHPFKQGTLVLCTSALAPFTKFARPQKYLIKKRLLGGIFKAWSPLPLSGNA